MNKYLLIGAMAVAYAVPAQAQDAGGFRVEGVVVYDDLNADLGSDSDEFNPDRDRDFDVAFGGGVGYDFVRWQGINAGVDVEYTESTAKKDGFVDGDFVGEIKVGNDLYVGGRVTAPISSNFRLVGKLGYTSLNLEFDPEDDILDEDDFPSDRLSGIRGAVGVHYSGSEDRTYYGVEYRYSNYEQDVVRHQIGLVVGAHF